MKGILLGNDDDDLAITVQRDARGMIKRGLAIGSTIIQNAYIVLRLHQGELKEDPILGANLTDFIRGKANRTAVEKRIKIHLTRAGIDYEKVKNEILTMPNMNSNE